MGRECPRCEDLPKPWWEESGQMRGKESELVPLVDTRQVAEQPLDLRRA